MPEVVFLFSMNIIIFTSATNKSGGSRQALYLATGMTERGHKVLFFVPDDAQLPELAPEEPFWRYFNKEKDWKERLVSVFPSDEPCVVHAFHNAAVKRAAWWGLSWRKKAVVVAHRGVIFRPKNPLPYWSPGIDGFLVNSMACVRILKTMGVSKKRLFYVPNAVPDSRLLPQVASRQLRDSLGIPADAFVFLCIANDNPNKGIRELMEAFALAFRDKGTGPQGEPHLLVAGMEHPCWREQACALRMEKRIHILGKTEDVGSLLAAASAFTLPSLSESMPNTLLEAVRAGLPCIGTNVGAVPDILAGAEPHCGLVVPPGDVRALVVAMTSMACNDVLRRELAAGAGVQGELYAPHRRLDLVEDIYTGLLRNKGLIR